MATQKVAAYPPSKLKPIRYTRAAPTWTEHRSSCLPNSWKGCPPCAARPIRAARPTHCSCTECPVYPVYPEQGTAHRPVPKPCLLSCELPVSSRLQVARDVAMVVVRYTSANELSTSSRRLPGSLSLASTMGRPSSSLHQTCDSAVRQPLFRPLPAELRDWRWPPLTCPLSIHYWGSVDLRRLVRDIIAIDWHA